MKENEKLIIKITNYLLHDVPSFIYDDIKQELLSLGFSILKNKNNITKLDDYLFISLRNCKTQKINEFNAKKMISGQKLETDMDLEAHTVTVGAGVLAISKTPHVVNP